MLEIKNLSVRYGHIEALRNISLTIERGKIVSVVGANGAGKSTLMMTLAGALQPVSGSITFEGKPLPRRPHEVLGVGICLVPERRRLYANLTVKENLQMGAFLRSDKQAIAEDMEAMFALFPVMKQRLTQYAGTLSGGEQQMVAIARGLMSRPKLLLLDEPSLGLAPLLVESVLDAVVDICNRGTTILLAEQNANQALEMADDAFVLETGRVVLSGYGPDLAVNPLVQQAYLGIKHNK